MSEEVTLIDTERKIKINSDKSVNIPMENFNPTIALQYETNNNIVGFLCTRYSEGHDLLSCTHARIIWENPNAKEILYQTGTYEILDRAESDQKNDDGEELFSFSWIIGPELTRYTGEINFQVAFLNLEEVGTEPQYEVKYRWLSNPVTKSNEQRYLRIGPSLPGVNDMEIEQPITGGYYINKDDLEQRLNEVYG